MDSAITSIQFNNYKAFERYSVALSDLNVLVGPNNSGKSTVIGAFRILDIALRRAHSKSPTIIETPAGDQHGYFLKEDTVPISLENVHTNYTENDSSITFRFSNANKLHLYFPNGGGVYLYADTTGRVPASPKEFRDAFPFSINVVPVLGPVEHNEDYVNVETVKGNLATHRASRNFRNYWLYFPEHFDRFSELIRTTWPGMRILAPERSGRRVIMMCKEHRYEREIFWAGFGFQIWCQLLTHISRSAESDLLIIDEPEVYLHPDIQRQFIGILRNLGPQVVLATHSTEILSESDAGEILSIDKTKLSAVRLKDIEGVQQVLESVGSVHNITLAHLGKTKRAVFYEANDDNRIIRRFAEILGFSDVAAGLDVTALESDGFSSWERIQALAWGFEKSFKRKLAIGAVFDRDYWPAEELAEIKKDLEKSIDFCQILERKEIENYLLAPAVIQRILDKERKGPDVKTRQPAAALLEAITDKLKTEVQSQLIAKKLGYFARSRIDSSTITAECIRDLEKKWESIDGRLTIVPGKRVLASLREELSRSESISLSDNKILRAFRPEDVPKDMKGVISRIEKFRKG